VVDDDICIVDPATYYVVTYPLDGRVRRWRLIAAAAGVVRRGHALHLRQRTEGSPGRRAHPLALGAEIPGRVDLERFPGGVIDRVPQVDGYRYIVVEDDVVIVDPTTARLPSSSPSDKAQSTLHRVIVKSTAGTSLTPRRSGISISSLP
jgi:hypothetical protein